MLKHIYNIFFSFSDECTQVDLFGCSLPSCFFCPAGNSIPSTSIDGRTFPFWWLFWTTAYFYKIVFCIFFVQIIIKNRIFIILLTPLRCQSLGQRNHKCCFMLLFSHHPQDLPKSAKWTHHLWSIFSGIFIIVSINSKADQCPVVCTFGLFGTYNFICWF